MPFDDVFAFPTSRPSGVAAAVAAAADVARATEPRHDEPTCCGERQEPDVGEGWRWVEEGEILQPGDECECPANSYRPTQWTPTHRAGQAARNPSKDRYRRRVTPEEQPLGACLDEENNELREQVATLTAEVERLRLTSSDSQILKRAAQLMCDHEPHFLFSINSMLGVAAKLDGRSVALDVERLGGAE